MKGTDSSANSPWSLLNDGYKSRLLFNFQDVVLLDHTEVWETEENEVASDDNIAI